MTSTTASGVRPSAGISALVQGGASQRTEMARAWGNSPMTSQMFWTRNIIGDALSAFCP